MKRCSNQHYVTFLDAQLANTALTKKSDTRFKRSSALLQSGSDITFCNSFCSGVCWFSICCGGGGGFRKSVLNIIGDGDDNHRSPNKSQFPQPPPLLPAARAQRLVPPLARSPAPSHPCGSCSIETPPSHCNNAQSSESEAAYHYPTSNTACTRPHPAARRVSARKRLRRKRRERAWCGGNVAHAEIVLWELHDALEFRDLR
jgi:hypothetical protein